LTSVTEASRNDRATLAGPYRLLAAVLGLGLLAPLAVAGYLEPDSQGHGTHQRLGLPPCTVYVLFGVRCPTCGMTTSWAHLVRGQVGGAFRANVGGALLGLLAVIGVPWLLVSAARGRWLGWVPDADVGAWIAAAVTLVTLADWAVRMLAR
jgi:hypothetical protein